MFWKFVGDVRGWKNVQKIVGGRPPEVEEGLESVAWRRQKSESKMAPKILPKLAQEAPKSFQNGSRGPPGALLGALGALWGPRSKTI